LTAVSALDAAVSTGLAPQLASKKTRMMETILNDMIFKIAVNRVDDADESPRHYSHSYFITLLNLAALHIVSGL
jgi:hypothetical protein